MWTAIIFGAAMAPIIFIFTFVYLQDKYEREPLRHLVFSFVLGILAAFPAVFLEVVLESGLDVHSGKSFFQTLEYAMVVVAAVEEGLKFLILRFYMFPKREFDEPYDGIMYAVAVSLGFAAIENVFYIFQGGMEVALLRMFTAVPGHAMFAVLMGFYAGLSKFPPERIIAKNSDGLFLAFGGSNGNIQFLEKELSVRKMLFSRLRPEQDTVMRQRGFAQLVEEVEIFHRRINHWRVFTMFKGLFAAIVAHGLYDFFLMWESSEGDNFVPLLAFVVLIVGIILARRAMKLHQGISPHQVVADDQS